MVEGGVHLSGLGAFYERRGGELKTLVLDVDPDDVDDDVPCDTVRVICDKLAGRGASLKENIEMAQRCFRADATSTDVLTMRNRCEVVMKGEWKRMAKHGQRSWEHIAAEHNQLPENVTMRAVFLRLMSPIGGLEAYCAHRMRESYPQNTDKLRDVSREVCLFFRDVPKSMPAFKVTFMASSPAYRGWLIVEPFTKEWFELRNGQRAAWIAGAMNITVCAAKLVKTDSQGNARRDLNLTPAHGLVESHPGLEWMRLYNAQPIRGNQCPRAAPLNMFRRITNDDAGREGWCQNSTFEQVKNSDAFLRSVTDAAERMDSTFHTLNLEFSDDAKEGPLGRTCMLALERGWVSSWRVGVSKPELLDKNSTPLVASEVIMTHDYTNPDDSSECLTGYTMTSNIKRDWMKANPPPLRAGVPNSELLGWFKGTWLAELLTHHCDKIESMVAGKVAERHNRIDEEIERQKRKEAAAKANASAFKDAAGLTKTQAADAALEQAQDALAKRVAERDVLVAQQEKLLQELATKEAAERSSSPLSFSDESMSDSDQSSENELRTECRMAADKFAEQRAADADKAPNMPPPLDLAAGSFSDRIHVVQEKKTVKKAVKKHEGVPKVGVGMAEGTDGIKRPATFHLAPSKAEESTPSTGVVDFDTARALAAKIIATIIQAAWRGRDARLRPFRQGMPPGCIPRLQALFNAENRLAKNKVWTTKLTTDAQEVLMAHAVDHMRLSRTRATNVIEVVVRIARLVLTEQDVESALKSHAQTPAPVTSAIQRVVGEGGTMHELETVAQHLRSRDTCPEWRDKVNKRWDSWLDWCRLQFLLKECQNQANVGPHDEFTTPDIASTKQSVLEASVYAIDRGHRVAEKGATNASTRKKTRKKQPPPPARSCSVPVWWTQEVTKQVPLGTNRIFHATSHGLEETRTSWVIGRVWPRHVADERPATMNNIIDHERQVAYAKVDPDWQRVLALTLSSQKSGLVKKWDVVFSYAINEHGREIIPVSLPKYTNPSVACAYTSTVYSEVTLPDGRTDRLTFEKDDPYGDCLVEMHFQRLVYHATREKTVPASSSDDEKRARLNAEALLREEDEEHRNRESKAKKKADARRACEKEQAERARLVREATEGATKTLAAKQAAVAAAHAEEQRRLAQAKKEEREREEAAKFEAVLSKKRADEATAAAEAAEAEAAENAALAEAYALKEAQEAAERAHAEEANRVRLAQAEMMARLSVNTVPAASAAPAPAPVTNGRGRGRANTGRGGRGGRGATAPVPPPKPEEDDDSKLCVVCFEEDKSRVCVPCGHVCMCSNCATNEKIKICPMCRVEITMAIPYFF